MSVLTHGRQQPLLKGFVMTVSTLKCAWEENSYIQNLDKTILEPNLHLFFMEFMECQAYRTITTHPVFTRFIDTPPALPHLNISSLRDVKRKSRPWKNLAHSFEYSYATKVFPVLLVTTPIFRAYDYWVRIDLDVRICKPFKILNHIDPSVNFYHTRQIRDSRVETGIVDFFKNTKCEIYGSDILQTYYSNFLVGSMRYFTDYRVVNIVLAWFYYSPGWKVRWTDQQIWPVARCFSNKTQVVDWTKYRGHVFVHKPNKLGGCAQK